jgi:sulfur-oxidizing protein SoxZ
MTTKPRVWISNRKPASGETVTVRAMVAHVMETGLRKNAEGQLIPRNIINRFECSLGSDPVLQWDLDTAVSRNPYLEFRFTARQSGELKMVWIDDLDAKVEVTETIEII